MSLRPRMTPVDSPDAVRRLIGPLYFGTAVVAGLAAASILALLPGPLPAPVRAGMCAAFVLFALFAGWALRGSRHSDFPLNAALLAVSLIAAALAVAVSVALGDGLHNPAIGFGALLVCMLCAVVGVRQGLALTFPERDDFPRIAQVFERQRMVDDHRELEALPFPARNLGQDAEHELVDEQDAVFW